MSFHFDKRNFAHARALPVIVLVDPNQRRLRNRRGLSHGDVAGVLARCRIALVHARTMGMAVAFVRDAPRTNADSGSGWIKGLEPARNDMVFERRDGSCYANPYFEEVAKTNGNLVFAGFFDPGGCVSTAADAVRAGTRITFLEDATLDPTSARMMSESSLAQLSALTHFEVYATGTHQWIASTDASQI